MGDDDIAIIGIGCRFPGCATSPCRLWSLLKCPHDLAAKTPSKRFNMDAFYVPEKTGRYGATNVQKGYWIEQDAYAFDADFFNISPIEATFMDPQQRVLMETVYEALEDAGLPLETLQGSLTGVYCGALDQDYGYMAKQDPDRILPLMPTGYAFSILANRISYFFDWKGPSMTIDTACAASLTAVHLAVSALRNKECSLAVAAGSNLMLSPDGFQSMSQMRILSDEGHCRMWDEHADGFARGEGVAAIILKRLGDALRDGDEITCLIRATGVGADGHNEGLTTPSSEAQLQLIRETYARAGLNPLRADDRCQYFEAHGTGTKVGDPKEALAVSRAFFDQDSNAEDILHVGSIKTIIGHLEATAGLSGIIKASLAVKHGVIPPNLHFGKVHPAIAPHMGHLRVPTEAIPWPKLPPGVPRRASINSFGFGGSNAHVIVESFDRVDRNQDVTGPTIVLTLPFIFSAASEERLGAVLQSYLQFLTANPTVDAIDLAASLMVRRSALPHHFISYASSIEVLREKIQHELTNWSSRTPSTSIGRPLTTRSKRILGIFTGQGAQWPQMGLDVIAASPQATSWLEELQNALDTLPEQYRPRFMLLEELAAPQHESRVNSAEMSLPLRTAIQIIQVRILRTLGVKFAAVVGHSSGEIPAAYAAGRLSAADAIRTAHLRGLSAQKAECDGAMLAVDISWEKAQAICNSEPYLGRVVASASNSPSNVTLSGDANFIRQLAWLLRSMDFNPQILRVDRSYHSHHMNPCAEYYAQAMKDCQIRGSPETSDTQWFSTVYDGQKMQGLEQTYWKENMLRPVLFSQAVTAALESIPEVGGIVEVGPHPALRGPTVQVIKSFDNDRGMAEIPYIAMAQRKRGGIETLQEAVGSLWTNLRVEKLDILAYIKLFLPTRNEIAFVPNLPLYPFDHSRSYGGLSRMARARLYRQNAINPLLGSMSCETGEHEWRWRNYLRSQDIDWLEDHQMESQVIFPVSGIISVAHEAAKIIAGSTPLQSVTIEELVLEHAIVITDGTEGVETMFTVQIEPGKIHEGDEAIISGHLRYYAAFSDELRCCCSGRIRLSVGKCVPTLLGSRGPTSPGLRSVDTDRFYREISLLGYGYSRGFKGLTNIQRRKDVACALIASHTYQKTAWPDPVMLDIGLQSILAAMGSPGDGQVVDIHLPVSIERITINSSLRSNGDSLGHTEPQVAVESNLTSTGLRGITGDVNIFDSDGRRMVQIERLSVVPLKSVASDGVNIFAETVWGPQHINVSTKTSIGLADYKKTARHNDHFALLCLQEIQHQLTADERARLDSHQGRYVAWMDRVLLQTRQGTHPEMRPEDLHADLETFGTVKAEKTRDIELMLLDVIRDNALAWLRGKTTLKEHLHQGDRLARYYGESAPMRVMNESLADLVAQIAFRLPRIKILEVGAGTGSATREILRRLAGTYHSYTYTDVSASFFEAAAHEFVDQGGARLQMKTLDIEKDPVAQDFVEHGYDLIVAANVLHATRPLNQTLRNLRRLLKPGGYLAILEITCLDVIAPAATAGAFEGWWVGVEDGRPWGPMMSVPHWKLLVKDTGFDDLESVTGKDEQDALRMSVMVAQATDERLSCLKSPLSMDPSAQYADLIVVGGTMGVMATVIEPLLDLLRPFFCRTTHANTLEEFAVPMNASRATILVLSDTDAPNLGCSITPERLSGLQQLVGCMGQLLWLGIEDEDASNLPYLHMSKALLACLRYEYPQSTIQHLVIDSQEAIIPEMIATNLMRLAHNKLPNDYELSQMVTTVEPELRLEKGILQIPRIKHVDCMNRRLRGSRGLSKERVEPHQSCVQVIETVNGLSLVSSPHQFQGSNSTRVRDHVRIRVRCATLPAIRIAPAIFLHVILGLEEAGGERMLALTQTHASVVSVEASYTFKAPSWLSQEDEAAYIEKVAVALIIRGLILQAPSGSTIIVHGSDLVEDSDCGVLSDLEAHNDVKVCYVSTSTSGKPGLWQISPWTPTHIISRQLPEDASIFVTLEKTVGDAIEKLQRLMKALGAAVFGVADIYRNQATGVPESRAGSIQDLLTVASLLSKKPTTKKRNLPTIGVDELSNYRLPAQRLEIVDWARDGLALFTTSMPASSFIKLSPNKTFILVGMTGEIGQSICRWMIHHGAHFVVLGSRSPSIDPMWIEEMAQLGAQVLGMSIDISDRASVFQIDEQIRQQRFPVVGGIINGAMVLNDKAFAEITIEGWRAVLAPKVIGSILLDELYRGSDLDFFILMGSISGCIGNMNQSAYGAANGFMSGLVHQRRRRHETASIVHPAQIRGLGYLERTDARMLDFLTDTMSSFALSESDLHELIAEAILAGHPESGRQAEILAGVRIADPAKYPNALWYSFPPMWHFIGHGLQTQTADTSSTQKLTIRAQLGLAEDLKGVVQIIGNAFQKRLRSKLKLPIDAVVTGSTRLAELGVDSLVAVDLRLWFRKELNLDMAIIQLLGNVSIEELATTAAQDLDQSLIPKVQGV